MCVCMCVCVCVCVCVCGICTSHTNSLIDETLKRSYFFLSHNQNKLVLFFVRQNQKLTKPCSKPFYLLMQFSIQILQYYFML